MFGDKEFNTLGFPTPTDVPETDGCRQFTIPSSTAWFALVMGCLMLLTEEENWQQFGGGIDVETAAQAAQAIIDSGYENECAGGEDLNTVPFWQSDDGSDAAVEDTEDTWYNEASYFVIGAFLATMVDPAAAITFTTNIRRLRLAYLKNGFGGIVEVIVDDVSVALIDTYASGTPYGVFYWDFGDDEEHTLELVNTGDANENAVVNPAYGEYTIGIVRWNIDQQSIDFANQQRYDDSNDVVQSSLDYGTTWIDTPEVDPRRMSHFPPPDTTDPQCDASARIVAYVSALIDGIEDGLAVSALIGTLIDIILASFAIWAGFLSLLLFLVEALATACIVAGLSNLQDNFTSAFYDRLLCYLYCHMGADGTLTVAGLQGVLDDLANNESTTIQNVFGAIAVLLGEGGLSDLAATRTETGDCGDCDCSFTSVWLPEDGHWAFYQDEIRNCAGTLRAAMGICGVVDEANQDWMTAAWTGGGNTRRINLQWQLQILPETTITEVAVYWTNGATNPTDWWLNLQGTPHCNPGLGTGAYRVTGLSLSDVLLQIAFKSLFNVSSGVGRVTGIVLYGTGLDPHFYS